MALLTITTDPSNIPTIPSSPSSCVPLLTSTTSTSAYHLSNDLASFSAPVTPTKPSYNASHPCSTPEHDITPPQLRLPALPPGSSSTCGSYSGGRKIHSSTPFSFGDPESSDDGQGECSSPTMGRSGKRWSYLQARASGSGTGSRTESTSGSPTMIIDDFSSSPNGGERVLTPHTVRRTGGRVGIVDDEEEDQENSYEYGQARSKQSKRRRASSDVSQTSGHGRSLRMTEMPVVLGSMLGSTSGSAEIEGQVEVIPLDGVSPIRKKQRMVGSSFFAIPSLPTSAFEFATATATASASTATFTSSSLITATCLTSSSATNPTRSLLPAPRARLAPQESPTTQTLRRRRQRAAWEGILGGMGAGMGMGVGVGAGREEDVAGGRKRVGLRETGGTGAETMDGTVVNDVAQDKMDVDSDVEVDLPSTTDACPGSPSPASRRTAGHDTILSSSLSTSIPFHPAMNQKTDSDREQETASSTLRELSLRDKMRGFELPGMKSFGGGGGRMMGGLDFKQGIMLGGKRGGRGCAAGRVTERYQADTTSSYLAKFTSHLVLADYRVTPNEAYRSLRAGRDWSAVYACAYSHAAKSGEGVGLLALASESGAVKVFDSNLSSKDEQDTAPATSKTFCPHDNAIFDVKWSPDDSMIMTCSADQTTVIYSADGSDRIATLRAHTSSVKTGVWYDTNILATSGRDGNIQIFDLRTRGTASAKSQAEAGVSRCKRARPEGTKDGELFSVMTIRNAHGNTGKIPNSRSATKSVTSLVALKSTAHTIASGGSADGIIKLWDLRAVYGGASNGRKQFISEAVGESLNRTADVGGTKRRSRGICSMVEGDGMLFTLGYGTSIHAHSLASLDTVLPMTYTHPSLKTSSFYIKLAISPCARYLTCGSTSGGVYTWEVGQQSRKILVSDGTGGEALSDKVIGQEMAWNGHTREVGAVDWGKDQIVSCSDDFTNRIWRPNSVAASFIKREPVDAAWHWAGINPSK